MFSKDKLSVFELNSHQPFVHGVWGEDKIPIGDEEALKGRSQLILNNFEKIIKKKFKDKDIENMTLLDIGSYDGYTSVEIEKRFKFKKIVSIEPREKNYLKGKFIRNFCNIKSNVKFQNCELDQIKEKFDIVFCVGVLHHLDNLSQFLSMVSEKAEKAIFIECQTSDAKKRFLNFFLKKLLTKIIEPKDEKFKKKLIGLSAHKFESNYSDGSTIKNQTVVSIPNNEYLEQLLYVNNFKSQILVSGKEYFKFIKSKLRNHSASIIYAEKYNSENLNKNEFEYIKKYETNYITRCINQKVINKIKKNKLNYYLQRLFISKENFEYEIIFNFRYNFNDKINFEQAKVFLKNKKIFKAVRILINIIGKYNSDYRCCYRAFAILSIIYKDKKDKKDLFLNLLKKCNNNYPVEILDNINLYN
jgi:hypothetical protein